MSFFHSKSKPKNENKKTEKGMLCKDSSYVSEDMLGIKHEKTVDKMDKKKLKEHVLCSSHRV